MRKHPQNEIEQVLVEKPLQHLLLKIEGQLQTSRQAYCGFFFDLFFDVDFLPSLLTSTGENLLCCDRAS